MSRILDRYASAINASDLSVSELTTYSDSDVLGAAGLAAKQSGLAMALARLFAGDNGSARELVALLADMVQAKAQAIRAKARGRLEAEDIARCVLAWHREGHCRHCGGHGFGVIPGTRTIGEAECGRCSGTGRIPFESQFHAMHVEIARWLLTEIEREQAKAGAAAMQKLAPKLEL